MHLSRSVCVFLTVGCLLAASACSNLTSPAGEDTDSLPAVGGSTEAPPTPNQPRLLPADKATDNGGGRDVALVRRILVAYQGAEGAKPEVKRSQEDARKLAVEIAAQLKQPDSDFAGLAKKHSDAPDAARGGLIPPFKRDSDVDPTLKSAAFKTAAGQFSGVLNTREGFLILQRIK